MFSNNLKRLCMVVVLSILLVMMMVNADESIDSADSGKRIDYPEYPIGARYDEYPVVVPKRAALLLDRLMVALKNAMEEDGETEQEVVSTERSGRANPNPRSVPVSQEDTMGMQRRGHGSIGGQHKGRVYWRCYFNAVTCFKKK